MSIRKAWGSHRRSLARQKTSLWEPRKVENYVPGVFPNVRGALALAVESQDEVTAAAVALGELELDDDMSSEVDGQLFIVLSALTGGERLGVVT